MKQVLQHVKTGVVSVKDVPVPVMRPGFVLVRTAASLISAGTERVAVESGQKGLVSRAIEQPGLVKKVFDKARNEGVLTTFEALRSKLESLTALGYSASGTIADLGDETAAFRAGDRVACAGLGYASHAEMLSVPKNLCVRLPQDVSRIIGEVCHFVDFIHFLTGSLTTRVYAESIGAENQETPNADSIFVTLRLADGSNAAIAYLAEGDKALPKERIEIFGGGKSFVIEDFRSATAYQSGKSKTTKLHEQDKGQREEMRTVCAMVMEGKPAPISLKDLATTTRATFKIKESLRTGLPVEV